MATFSSFSGQAGNLNFYMKSDFKSWLQMNIFLNLKKKNTSACKNLDHGSRVCNLGLGGTMSIV